MIIAVTPNPAVDVTYRTETIELGGVNRVAASKLPGGKGINVARVVTELGDAPVAAGILAGDAGAFIAHGLEHMGIAANWTWHPGETRSTINVLTADGESTMFNEAGPAPTPETWATLIDSITVQIQLAKDAEPTGSPTTVVTLSGSLPPGVSGDQLAALMAAARAATHVIVDVSGPALLLAAAAGVSLLKPNSDELLAATGAESVEDGIEQLLNLGAHAIALSLGEDGMHLITRDARYAARPTEVIVGNPTGAGDAAVAAFAHHLNQYPGPNPFADPDFVGRALPSAVALSAAAVAAPGAGEYDQKTYAAMRPAITLEHVNATR